MVNRQSQLLLVALVRDIYSSDDHRFKKIL